MRKSEKAKEDQLIFRNDIEKSRSKYNIEESLLKGINLPEHAKKHLKYLLKAILEVNYWKYVTPGSDVQKTEIKLFSNPLRNVPLHMNCIINGGKFWKQRMRRILY